MSSNPPEVEGLAGSRAVLRALAAYRRCLTGWPSFVVLFKVEGLGLVFGPDAVKAAGVCPLVVVRGEVEGVAVATFPPLELDTVLRDMLRAGIQSAVAEGGLQ